MSSAQIAAGPQSVDFRAIMGSFPTGVTVVTARIPGQKSVGFTANSVASTSLNPPLLLVCASNLLYSVGVIRQRGFFGVNFLSAAQAQISDWFATSSDQPKFLESVKHTMDLRQTMTENAVPKIDNVCAFAECRLVDAIPAGDHTILLGEVLDGFAVQKTPLMYYKKSYFPCPVAEPMARTNGDHA